MKAEKGASGFGTLRQVLEIRVGQNHIDKVKKKKRAIEGGYTFLLQ